MERIIVTHPLKPIVDSHSKVLVLGSFPSVKSRENQFYYGNPQNRFWQVMRLVFDEDIDDKEAFLHRKHIAMYDVVFKCSIVGSTDSALKPIVYAPLEKFLKDAPIHTVFTTGSKASSLYKKHFHLPICHISLPSTSAANAKMRIETLVEHYQKIKEALL